MTPSVAPYGTWPSPLDPAQMAAQGRRYGYAAFADDGAVVWCEQRADQGGRVVPMRRGLDGVTGDLIGAEGNARSRVHEYGGRAYALDASGLWYTHDDDQRLHRVEGGLDAEVSMGEGWRFAEMVYDPHRQRLVAVGERHLPGERYPENGLVTIDPRSGAVSWLVRGHDFVASPKLSPDGRQLAFVAWDHPAMAWDAAALYVATVLDDGSLGDPVRVAGDAQASVNGLLWRDDETLIFALEVDGRWQPHAWQDGRVRRLADVPGEFGAPLWNIGTQTFALASHDELVGVLQREGRSVVVSLDLREGTVRELRDDLPHVGHLDARGPEMVLVLGYNSVGVGVLHVDRARGVDTLLAGDVPAGKAPQAVRFPSTEGADAHGFLHLPDHDPWQGPPGSLPPLMVTAHGGPTGFASPLPSPAVRFWTTRGFAVLDVNYRGSTGYGRPYREALRGRWGDLDVADCIAGARWLVAEGRVRGDGVFIRGASAGGYTVLQALCESDVFRGGSCHYGISDPRSCGAETHKMESHYEAFLFGTGEALEAALRARTPLDHPERIGAPVIFFQGLEDLAVPPDQTRRIHEALQARGLASEFYGYPGEQHGFRRAETIEDVWGRELAFFQRLL